MLKKLTWNKNTPESGTRTGTWCFSLFPPIRPVQWLGCLWSSARHTDFSGKTQHCRFWEREPSSLLSSQILGWFPTIFPRTISRVPGCETPKYPVVAYLVSHGVRSLISGDSFLHTIRSPFPKISYVISFAHGRISVSQQKNVFSSYRSYSPCKIPSSHSNVNCSCEGNAASVAISKCLFFR